ncbi:hypothetical protein LCGC14_1765600, partial [marine sediment metagenome]
GYPLMPKWFSGEVHPFGCNIVTKNTNVIALGIKATDDFGPASAVDLVPDPATVTIVTALTSTDGIKVYYPDTEIEISPSDMEFLAGSLVISIPKGRLMKYELRDNPATGRLSSTAGNYQTTVDVKRHYNDASKQIVAVWPHGCNLACSSSGCSRYTEAACGTILDAEIGEISFQFATYSAGSWTTTRRICCRGNPKKLEISYEAGTQELESIAEMAIIRLAHSKMPGAPCGCDVIHNMWIRDTEIPIVLSVERLECPFGLSNGAWMAWKFAGTLEIDRMTVFG